MGFYGMIALISVALDRMFGWGNQERLIIIAIVLITLPFTLIIAFFAMRKRKKDEKQTDAAVVESSAQQNLNAPAGSYDEISKGIEEVVQFVKSSNLGQAKGKDALYSLPWFIVAGPSGSGKSSLVLGSNLNFQTLPSQRQSEQKFVKATQSVDWRVTSDALFVDTAGRYQKEGSDQDEWAALLEAIRKNRSNRPVDGIVLAVSAERIIKADEREIEELAKVMRLRLDEAVQRFKNRFPVYLVFTNADSIEGFRDSFSVSKKEGQALVWGSTFPLDKADSAHAMFDSEFELLQGSVMKRRLMRLSAPFAAVRQLRIFNFPLHFGASRRKFGALVSALFRPNPFSENPLFRGFYFTASPSSGKVEGQTTMSGGGAATVGETFFSERFFRDVLLRDKDLARTFQENRKRPPILGWSLTAIGALLTLTFLILSGVSLFNNKRMLDDAEKKAQVVLANVKADENINPLTKDATAARQEIDAIEDLRVVLEKLDDYQRNGAPFYLGLGLYSGNQIYKQKLLKIYFNAIERRFKTPTIKKVEAELKKFADGPAVNPGKLSPQDEDTLSKNYDLLKAYLMMTDKYRDKASGTDVALAFKDYWKSESKLPSDLEAVANLQLEFWAKQVDRDEFPRVFVDERALVANVRTKLKAFPPVFRYYKRKTTEISKIVEGKIGPTNVESILAREGGDVGFVDGSYTVPGAFTVEGYKLMREAINNADKEISADDWVMGEQGKGDLTSSTDQGRLEEKYFGNYTDHWRNFVRGISVKVYTKDNAKDALDSFASSRSPMKILLSEIERNTNFSKPKDSGWWDYLVGIITGLFESQISLDTGGNSQVEKEFRPLFDFVKSSGDKNAKIPVEEYQTEIGLVAEKFRTFSPSEINEISTMSEEAREKKFGQLGRSSAKIEGMLKSFKETPSGQALSDVLMQPLGALEALLGAGAKDQLAKKWTNDVLAAAKDVEKGFPFDDAGGDADLTKVKDFLNPTDGKFTKFFDDNLKKDFTEENGTLKVSDTSRFKYTDEFVAYVNALVKLRTALFGKNPTPGFEYTISIKPVTGGAAEATVDGQSVRADASATLKFPAQTGAESGVLLKLSGDAGTAPTTPPGNGAQSGGEVRTPGTWGLFKFVFQGQPKLQSTGEYLLTYTLSGKTVNIVIKSNGGDVFDRNIFKARAPQTVFK